MTTLVPTAGFQVVILIGNIPVGDFIFLNITDDELDIACLIQNRGQNGNQLFASGDKTLLGKDNALFINGVVQSHGRPVPLKNISVFGVDQIFWLQAIMADTGRIYIDDPAITVIDKNFVITIFQYGQQHFPGEAVQVSAVFRIMVRFFHFQPSLLRKNKLVLLLFYFQVNCIIYESKGQLPLISPL